MTRPDLTIDELGLEVENLVDDLVSSPGDPTTLKAKFVAQLAELDAATPELEHVEAELDRLTTQAVTLAFGATPEQTTQLIQGLADIHAPFKRLYALGDLVAGAASRFVAAHEEEGLGGGTT